MSYIMNNYCHKCRKNYCWITGKHAKDAKDAIFTTYRDTWHFHVNEDKICSFCYKGPNIVSTPNNQCPLIYQGPGVLIEQPGEWGCSNGHFKHIENSLENDYPFDAQIPHEYSHLGRHILDDETTLFK